VLQRFSSRLRDLWTKRIRRRSDTSATAEREIVYTLAKSRVPNIRQLRYLPRILSKPESKLIRTLAGLIAVAIVFLGVRVYARNVVYLPKAGGEIIEGLLGNPQYVNPVLTGTNDVDRDLSRLLYAGLLRRNAEGEIVPDLAESYEISPDGKIYTVRLAQGLTWSDGEPLSADDVMLTFELITDQLYKSPLRSQYRNVTVERVDDHTVKFTLAQSSAAFAGKLTVGILPAHIWGDVPPPNFGLIEYNSRPVGAGPYKFESLKRDANTGFIKEYRLIVNPNYHGQKPYIEKLTFKFYEDPALMAESIRQKTIEGISVVSKDERDNLRQVRAVDLQMLRYTSIFFNSKRSVVSTPEVRKALAAAVDRQAIIDNALNGAGIIVDGPIPPAVPGSVSGIQPAFNPDEARRILEEAGWKITDDSGIRKKGDAKLELSLTVVDQPEDLEIAEIVKQNWEAVGALVLISPYDATRIASEIVKPRNYDAFIYGEILTSDTDLYAFWHSSQQTDPGLNLTRFFNKDADTLLEELRTITDPNQIIEKRTAFQNLLVQGTHVFFLYSPFYTYGLPKRVKGFDMGYVTTPADRYNGIADWYVKTSISFK